MLWMKRRARPVRRSDLTGFIDEGSEVEGKYTFSGTVMLNGRFKGEIASTDTLIIGEKGGVDGTVHAAVIFVAGQVVGKLVATERVELQGRARVFGDLETPVLVTEEGALFEGQCQMTKSKQIEAAPARDSSVVPLKRNPWLRTSEDSMS